MSRIVPSQSLRQREPRVRDQRYLHWLHGLPCIACEIEPAPTAPASRMLGRTALFNAVFAARMTIEAAHQKGVAGPSLGKRPSDAASCPLCAWHHRLAPDACDPAQRQFWNRLGIDVADFCQSLYVAFKAGEDGATVVRSFSGQVRERKPQGD